MRSILVAASFSLICLHVGAAEECGMRVVKLLVSGKAAEVPRLFVREDPSMLSQLNQILESTGAISEIVQVKEPRFGESWQYKVVAPDLPRRYSSINYRISASSVHQGPIQFSVAKVPDSECTLLSIGLEVNAKK